MAQHAILRFEKHKGNPARPLEAHHERQKDQYASNPDIDTSRSKYNFHYRSDFCFSHQPLWTADAGGMAAWKASGPAICHTGLAVLKLYIAKRGMVPSENHPALFLYPIVLPISC